MKRCSDYLGTDRSIPYIVIDCSRHPSVDRGDPFHCDYKKSSYPSGSDRDSSYGNSGGSGNNGSSGSSSVINVGIGYDYAPGKHAYNISFNSIKKQISNPQHGYLVPEKTINLRNSNLSDSDIGVLAGNLQYQRLDLDVFDVSNNKIGFGGVENLFYGLRFDNTLSGRYILTMNFSNNLIDDNGAKYMADSLAMGRFPNLKSLDVSGNQITSTGYGYLGKGLEVVTQDLKIVFEATKGFSKDALKATMKSMLFIAKSNGINTKEMLTTDETIGHCIKGIPNVALNIGAGYLKCTSKIVKAYNYKDITLGDVVSEILGLYSQPLNSVLNFVCITQNTVFSVVDEEFANCLVGVSSMLNE